MNHFIEFVICSILVTSNNTGLRYKTREKCCYSYNEKVTLDIYCSQNYDDMLLITLSLTKYSTILTHIDYYMTRNTMHF